MFGPRLHGRTEKPELLLLHALPLDGTMWAGQMGLLPGSTHAPTLYDLGETVEEWATAALKLARGSRLIVVGCSVGGSCALEVARAAPDRVSALVLIGTKAKHSSDPALHDAALRTLRDKGMEESWRQYWEPLFSAAAAEAIASGKRIAATQSPESVARGITAFHRRASRTDVLSTFPRSIAVVTGADDTAPGLKTSSMQSEAAVQGSLHIVGECGHYVPLERPAALNSILRKAVAAQDDRGASRT